MNEAVFVIRVHFRIYHVLITHNLYLHTFSTILILSNTDLKFEDIRSFPCTHTKLPSVYNIIRIIFLQMQCYKLNLQAQPNGGLVSKCSIWHGYSFFDITTWMSEPPWHDCDDYMRIIYSPSYDVTTAFWSLIQKTTHNIPQVSFVFKFCRKTSEGCIGEHFW